MNTIKERLMAVNRDEFAFVCSASQKKMVLNKL